MLSTFSRGLFFWVPRSCSATGGVNKKTSFSWDFMVSLACHLCVLLLFCFDVYSACVSPGQQVFYRPSLFAAVCLIACVRIRAQCLGKSYVPACGDDLLFSSCCQPQRAPSVQINSLTTCGAF